MNKQNTMGNSVRKTDATTQTNPNEIQDCFTIIKKKKICEFNVINQLSSDCISLYVIITRCNNNIHLQLHDSTFKYTKINGTIKIFKQKTSLNSIKTIVFENFIIRNGNSEIHKIFYGNRININETIILEIDISVRQPLRYKTIPTMIKDISSIQHTNTDFEIRIKNTKYSVKCHKFILQRLEFFEVYFTRWDKKKNFIELEDIQPQALEILVHFLYNDEIPDYSENLEKIIYNLLEISNRYQVHGLTKICLHFMIQFLKRDNLLERFSIFQKYNFHDEANHCLKLLKENKDILRTKTWKQMLRTQTDLCQLIIDKVCVDDDNGSSLKRRRIK